ncbi:MAG: extracellular solute-binding protein [Oscillospiraceae bacterium]|jgi:ABC-type glycerol-3-phosphate transport system substrate-binding protein|nr:extracellular solute-binding protein [Oscillospiraceae bacterium]
MRRILSLAMLACCLAGLFIAVSENVFAEEAATADALTYEGFARILDTAVVNGDIPVYSDYSAALPQSYPRGEIIIEASDYSRYDRAGQTARARTLVNAWGMEGISVIAEEDAVIEYAFTVTETGWYQPMLDYYPIEGKSVAIQRALFVDGTLPCRELSRTEFPRFWSNTAEPDGQGGFVWRKDNQGNDMRPSMAESPEWSRRPFHDADGYVTAPLLVYLTAGEHTMTLFPIREPILLRRVVWGRADTARTPPYSETIAGLDSGGARDSSGESVSIQAEHAARTSSQMLYPVQDVGSALATPSSPKLLLNNAIGGNPWRLAGQWIEWEFDIPSDGYYHISVKVNQNLKRGIYVSRKITIDGIAPFAEMEDYGFTFAMDWRLETLSDPDGEPYRFYLAKGRHTLRMEATLGGFSRIISQARDSVYEMNAIYRKVIQLTGVAPDRFRDYQIERSLPALSSQMESARDRLSDVINLLQTEAGGRSDRERALITMRDQLTQLIADNELFPRQINSFKMNARACGTWLNEAMLQPLALDEIIIHSPDSPPQKARAAFVRSALFEIQRLAYSFLIDYNAIGNVSDDASGVTLWVGSGRDQANVIKRLIDDAFTSETGINVNVMLVDMSTLLQATLAGQGPDAAIQVGWDLPMNYGLRGAVRDLSAFDDLDEVKDRFAPSAMLPYEFGGAVYALPETQVFPMLFYRKDILAEMGLSVPQTWDEVNVALAALARSQMEIGILPGENIWSMLLYQNGGEYYNEDATRSALDSEEAMRAFRQYTELYTDYRLDRLTSLEERFRTGECPMIIADYSVYNNLQVSAPDLRGLWGMAPAPGIRREDGSIDRSVGGYGGACVMMRGAEDPQAVWRFMKWWTSAETQVAYGREMESLMGASARVPTANLEAFERMPWPLTDLIALTAQREQAKGIPQAPGGYFTYRNVNNAFYSVTTPETDRTQREADTPREALADQVILINDEIRYKRAEFGLPLE